MVADISAVGTWVDSEALPMFGMVDEDNFNAYLDSAPEGMLWLCFAPDKLSTAPAVYAKELSLLARPYRGKIPFVWLDTVEFEEHAKDELGCATYDTVVIQRGNLAVEDATPERYRKVLSPDFKASEVTAFLAEVLAGKVEPIDELDELDDEDGDASDNGDDE